MPPVIPKERAPGNTLAALSARPECGMDFTGQRKTRRSRKARSESLWQTQRLPDTGRPAAAVNPSKQPFNGYYFRILNGQGSHASGGAYSYVINGRMMGGFAVIAWPAKYGASGFKTFMVNHDQTVYEADLGPDTKALVQEMQTFDPDEEWQKVEE